MIDKLFRLMKAGTFRLVGSGHSRVQLVYIDDLAWAIAESALRQELDGAEFLCTYENPISTGPLRALRKNPRPASPLAERPHFFRAAGRLRFRIPRVSRCPARRTSGDPRKDRHGHR